MCVLLDLLFHANFAEKVESKTAAPAPSLPFPAPSSTSVTYKQSFPVVESVVLNFLIKILETDRQTNGERQAERQGRQVRQTGKADRQREKWRDR